jgi:hypothetical protein
MPFTHVAKYQARIAARDIAGERVAARYDAIPRVTFSDPELAAVGMTERQAREQHVDVASACVDLSEAIARPSTYEREPRGQLGLVADRHRGVLVGAWAAAPLASEWIHQAALAIRAKVPVRVLRETVAQFRTFSEAYFVAVEKLAPQLISAERRGRARRTASPRARREPAPAASVGPAPAASREPAPAASPEPTPARLDAHSSAAAPEPADERGDEHSSTPEREPSRA